MKKLFAIILCGLMAFLSSCVPPDAQGDTATTYPTVNVQEKYDQLKRTTTTTSERTSVTTTTKKRTTTRTTTTRTTATTTEAIPVITRAPETDPEPVSRTVYITPTGKRYHYRSTCGGKNSYAVTLDEAIADGFTPCKKCAR